tara:strand:+ start:2231 stop:2623 length:393 start_codon:yes stop_codon:yes gene_type:complete
MILTYIILYFYFGVCGWLIDTSYRSLRQGRYAPGGYPTLFAPDYGLGGLGFILIFQFVPLHAIWQVILAGGAATLVELIAGLFCLHVLGRRIWDYSDNFLNIGGHVDALHAFYWIVLAGVFRWLFVFVPI